MLLHASIACPQQFVSLAPPTILFITPPNVFPLVLLELSPIPITVPHAAVLAKPASTQPPIAQAAILEVYIT